ncbi:hypothetical protein Tco_0435934 [Tanacetum coccineum]
MWVRDEDTLVDPAEARSRDSIDDPRERSTLGRKLADSMSGEYTSTSYALLEDAQKMAALNDSPGDSMDGGGGGLSFPRGLGSFIRIESGNSQELQSPTVIMCIHMKTYLQAHRHELQLQSVRTQMVELSEFIQRNMSERWVGDMLAEFVSTARARRIARHSGTQRQDSRTHDRSFWVTPTSQSLIRTLGQEAYGHDLEGTQEKDDGQYWFRRGEIKTLEIEAWTLKTKERVASIHGPFPRVNPDMYQVCLPMKPEG